MSTRVMDACWGLRLPPTEKAVLVSLADQANDAGVCWPSVASLMERTCLSERTVRRALRALEDAVLLATDLGAMKNNRYRLNVPRLRVMAQERERELAAQRQQELELMESTGATVAGDVWNHRGHTGRVGASVAGEGGQCGPRTVIEPNTNTPHTPQAGLGGLPASDSSVPSNPPVSPSAAGRRGREARSPVELATWLAELQDRDEDAISTSDGVFGYAAGVGIGDELIGLAWAVFKRRMITSRKRQRDWRQTFRNYVEGNYLGLWSMREGQPATLTSKGEQARRWQEAQQLAQQQAMQEDERDAA